jgi:hypothetical protein
VSFVSSRYSHVASLTFPILKYAASPKNTLNILGDLQHPCRTPLY